MSAVVRHYVQTAEGRMHYRERPGDGPPILFLHQTPSSSVMWERAMLAYPPGRRLLAPDTAGFGGSDAPPPLPGIADYARRALQFLDALGVDRFDLVGFHTGAVIGTEVAAQAPQRVGRLVLIGLVVVTPQEGAGRLDDIHRWELDRRGTYLDDRLIPHMRDRVTADDPGHFRDELVATIQAGPDWWWAYDAVFTYDARARLPLVTAPMLLAVGDGDEPSMFPWSQAAAQLAPAAEYRVLEGLGVEMCFEAPQAVVEVVDGFLGDGTSDRSGAGAAG
jgi:pimeloyl-ACP methyl ester carboxylesterase